MIECRTACVQTSLFSEGENRLSRVWSSREWACELASCTSAFISTASKNTGRMNTGWSGMGPSRVLAPSPCWVRGLLSQWNPWCPSPHSSFLFARHSRCGGVAWEPKDSWSSLEGISAFHSHGNLIYKPIYEHWWQSPPFIKGWCISFVISLKFKCWVGVENFLQLFWEMVQVFVGDTVFLSTWLQ